MTDTVSISELLHAVDTADSAPALMGAVRSLSAVRSPQAIETLIAVLGFNNPGAAVAAVDGLVALGETSVPALLDQLDGYDYGARAWSIRALSMIGDPRASDILIETARGDFALSVRRAAARGLGFIQWEKMPEDQRARAQWSALSALKTSLNDAEWVVRYASVVGLSGLAAALSIQRETVTQIRDCLFVSAHQDAEIVVQARAKLALSHLR